MRRIHPKVLGIASSAIKALYRVFQYSKAMVINLVSEKFNSCCVETVDLVFKKSIGLGDIGAAGLQPSPSQTKFIELQENSGNLSKRSNNIRAEPMLSWL